jgi:hypothetical protein
MRGASDGQAVRPRAVAYGGIDDAQGHQAGRHVLDNNIKGESSSLGQKPMSVTATVTSDLISRPRNPSLNVVPLKLPVNWLGERAPRGRKPIAPGSQVPRNARDGVCRQRQRYGSLLVPRRSHGPREVRGPAGAVRESCAQVAPARLRCAASSTADFQSDSGIRVPSTRVRRHCAHLAVALADAAGSFCLPRVAIARPPGDSTPG